MQGRSKSSVGCLVITILICLLLAVWAWSKIGAAPAQPRIRHVSWTLEGGKFGVLKEDDGTEIGLYAQQALEMQRLRRGRLFVVTFTTKYGDELVMVTVENPPTRLEWAKSVSMIELPHSQWFPLNGSGQWMDGGGIRKIAITLAEKENR